MKKDVIITSSNGDNWKGEIEILSKDLKKAYVQWTVFDTGNNFIASFTNSYFFGSEGYSDEDIFSRIAERMLDYRINRKRIFEKITIV